MTDLIPIDVVFVCFLLIYVHSVNTSADKLNRLSVIEKASRVED